MTDHRPPVDSSGVPGAEDAANFDPSEERYVTVPAPDVLRRAQASEASTVYLNNYDMWCVTRYADVRTAFGDSSQFSSAKMVRRWPPPPETADLLPDGHPLENAPVSTDPPEHTRIRTLAQRAFTAKMVQEREPAVRRIVERYADELTSGRSAGDLVKDYSAKIPPAVVADVLGVPDEDAETFRLWALEAHHLGFSGPTLPDSEVLRLSREMVDFDQYVRSLVAARRDEPQEDLISYLVHAEGDDGERLPDRRLVGLIASLVTAGSDTTSSLIAHMFYALFADDQLRADVTADRSLVGPLIEETLRYYPSARALRRTTKCPVHIGGVDVPEDATVMVHVGVANRDPMMFEDPDRFDIRRPNVKQHLAFGSRAHTCLGAPLARLEARLAVEALLDRTPDIRLAPGVTYDADLFDDNVFIPSLLTMPVVWGSD